MMVREAMRAHVTTVRPDATVQDLVDIMDLYQMRCVPVADDRGTLVGVVTERDVAAACAEDPARAAGGPVSAIMAADPVGVDECAGIEEAFRAMASRGFAHLPVVSDGRVVGIIGRIDLLQAALTQPSGSIEERKQA